MKSKAARRRLRTLLLAIVASIALFWGAVDIAGVPAANLWQHLGGATLSLLLLMVFAAAAGWLLTWRHRRRQRSMGLPPEQVPGD
jgi:membrane protease YdiL (CAAX protease family)